MNWKVCLTILMRAARHCYLMIFKLLAMLIPFLSTLYHLRPNTGVSTTSVNIGSKVVFFHPFWSVLSWLLWGKWPTIKRQRQAHGYPCQYLTHLSVISRRHRHDLAVTFCAHVQGFAAGLWPNAETAAVMTIYAPPNWNLSAQTSWGA